MVDNLFIVPLQKFVYSIATFLAATVWSGARAMLIGGFMIQSLTDWITNTLFGPAISEVSFISQAFIPLFATIAVFLLAFTYLLSPFFQIRVVAWQKALGWLLLATLFFQYGPSFYVEGEQMRRQISSDFYQLALDKASGAGSMSGLSAIQTGADDIPLLTLKNNFAPYLSGDQYIDGIDVALAFLLAGANDVLTAPDLMPGEFLLVYFPEDQGPIYWLTMSDEERNAVIGLGVQGIFRIVLGYLIILFGIVEQLIYLCLAIAMGLLFVSLAVALPFALFERTELMARSVLDMMLELFIFSVILSVMQALTVGVVLSGAQSLNPALALGAAAIGLVVESVMLLRALSAIWDASNRMFTAMGQVVGGKILGPGEVAAMGATAAGAAAAALATGGASLAMSGLGAGVTAAAGGSREQVLGAALSGSDALFNTAALGQMMLPDGSQLKSQLQGVYEGALAQRLMPGVGGVLLREGGPPQPKATAPTAAGRSGAAGSASTPPPSEEGEQDIRFDAADIAQLRDALAAAMNAAMANAPRGGYSNPNDILSAVQRHLGDLGGDPKMGAYLSQKQGAVVSYVMGGTQIGLTQQAQQAGAPVDTTPASRPPDTAAGGSATDPVPGSRSPTTRGTHQAQVSAPGTPGPHRPPSQLSEVE